MSGVEHTARQSPRAASWSTRGGNRPQQPEDADPRGSYRYGYHPGQGPPLSPQSPKNGIPPQHPTAASFDPLMAHVPIIGGPQRSLESGAYPSPPYSPQKPATYASRHYAGLPEQSWRPMDDVEEHGSQQSYRASDTNYSQSEFEDNERFAPRRPSYGYSSLHDYPTVEEEVPEMRGVSYPGQEWMPGRWE